MPEFDNTGRRRFMAIAGGTVLTASLAGCMGDDDDEPADDDTDDNGDDDYEYLDEEPDYGGFLDDANLYEGQTVDWTGESDVTVIVGADDGFAFEPAAIAVDPGTTVTWEWTGQGGDHDVVHEDGEFESDRTAEAGHTFSHTFEDSGVYNYVCEPHVGQGMLGSVYVVE